MPKPYLIVVAGCNGSGKSTFSKTYVKGLTPFDYDKRFMDLYSNLPDSEYRDKFAKDQTIQEFEHAINLAFEKRQNFCYETNFDTHPVFWVNKAIELGYHVELHFYCLSSLELAIERVSNRVRHKGHPVYDEVVFYKWKEGYKNLNIYYKLFDFILLIDNSSSQKPMQNLFALIKNTDQRFEIEFYTNEIPVYTKNRMPEIFEMYLNQYVN